MLTRLGKPWRDTGARQDTGVSSSAKEREQASNPRTPAESTRKGAGAGMIKDSDKIQLRQSIEYLSKEKQVALALLFCEAAKQCLDHAPDTEEFSHPLMLAALNAVLSVVETMEFLADNDVLMLVIL
jgi:hypothetical protein